jgi:hypothetical protein
LTEQGGPLRAVGLNQFIYGTDPGAARATAGFTDFTYDATGRLVGSDNTYWVDDYAHDFVRHYDYSCF